MESQAKDRRRGREDKTATGVHEPGSTGEKNFEVGEIKTQKYGR
jgi:hypothetical protein